MIFLGVVFLSVSILRAQEFFTIEGHVPSLPDSTVLFLYLQDEQDVRLSQVVDTAYVLHGRFVFRYPIEKEARFDLDGQPEIVGPTFLQIWARPGITLRMTGKEKWIDAWVIESPVPEQQESERYRRAIVDLQDKYRQARIEKDSLREESGRTFPKDKEEIDKEMRRKQEVQDSLNYLMAEKTLSEVSRSELSEVAVEQLSKISRMIFHYKGYAGLRERAVEQYERLSPGQQLSDQGREIALGLFPPDRVKIGDEMVEDSLPDLSGRLHSLTDYKGKYILLDFWASWCEPCLASVPELKEVAEIYRDRLTLIGISLDKNREDWLQATRKHGVSWVNLNAPDQSEIAAKYGINGIPHQVLISPEGMVLGAWSGYSRGSIETQLKKYIPSAE